MDFLKSNKHWLATLLIVCAAVADILYQQKARGAEVVAIREQTQAVRDQVNALTGRVQRIEDTGTTGFLRHKDDDDSRFATLLRRVDKDEEILSALVPDVSAIKRDVSWLRGQKEGTQP